VLQLGSLFLLYAVYSLWRCYIISIRYVRYSRCSGAFVIRNTRKYTCAACYWVNSIDNSFRYFARVESFDHVVDEQEVTEALLLFLLFFSDRRRRRGLFGGGTVLVLVLLFYYTAAFPSPVGTRRDGVAPLLDPSLVPPRILVRALALAGICAAAPRGGIFGVLDVLGSRLVAAAEQANRPRRDGVRQALGPVHGDVVVGDVALVLARNVPELGRQQEKPAETCGNGQGGGDDEAGAAASSTGGGVVVLHDSIQLSLIWFDTLLLRSLLMCDDEERILRARSQEARGEREARIIIIVLVERRRERESKKEQNTSETRSLVVEYLTRHSGETPVLVG